jgi:hypothetical protein
MEIFQLPASGQTSEFLLITESRPPIPESDRSPLHDVRQHAALGHAIARMQSRARANSNFSTNEICGQRLTASGSKSGPPTEAAPAAKVGGARRDRTDDLLLAKQALSQLSYGPI